MSDTISASTDLYTRLMAICGVGNDQLLEHGNQPLLAHYTSPAVLESMARTSEIWLSNPLFMNDLDEMRFGMITCENLFLRAPEVEAADPLRISLIRKPFADLNAFFVQNTVLDSYLFCACQHDRDRHKDGLLSMWRGYGGHGNGVAIVFDTSKIELIESSPLLIIRVKYASRAEREEKIRSVLLNWCGYVKGNRLSDEQLQNTVALLFLAFKFLSLTWKHEGFSEEQEWRLIYFPELDPENLLRAKFSYMVGPRGVEPKLKYEIGYLRGVSAASLQFSNLVDRIILGPGLSSPLSIRSFQRMLESIGKPELSSRVVGSQIPLRPQGAVF